MCSVATHAVGGDAGYCLLWLIVPTGYLKMKMPYNEKAACTLEVSKCRLPHAKNACIPHTPYTLVLEFVPPAGRVCGAATHTVGRGAGYGLL